MSGLRVRKPLANGLPGEGAAGGGRGGALMLSSGAYTVKLTVDGKSYTQRLTVKPDPRSRSVRGQTLNDGNQPFSV